MKPKQVKRRSIKDRSRMGGPRVKGVITSMSGGHGQAQKMFKISGICQRCKVNKAEVRHHKDENYLNNLKKNIELLCKSCHTSHHHLGKEISESTRELISEGNKGNQKWLGKNHSEESRKKMSVSQAKVAKKRKRDKLGRWS